MLHGNMSAQVYRRDQRVGREEREREREREREKERRERDIERDF